MIDSAWIGIAGVVIGVALTEASTLWREHRRNRREDRHRDRERLLDTVATLCDSASRFVLGVEGDPASSRAYEEFRTAAAAILLVAPKQVRDAAMALAGITNTAAASGRRAVSQDAFVAAVEYLYSETRRAMEIER